MGERGGEGQFTKRDGSDLIYQPAVVNLPITAAGDIPRCDHLQSKLLTSLVSCRDDAVGLGWAGVLIFMHAARADWRGNAFACSSAPVLSTAGASAEAAAGRPFEACAGGASSPIVSGNNFGWLSRMSLWATSDLPKLGTAPFEEPCTRMRQTSLSAASLISHEVGSFTSLRLRQC